MRIENIYIKYRDKLKGYISKYVSSNETVEDMLQNVFYKFIISDNEDTIQSVASWLYRVSKNQIIDYWKKSKESPMPYITLFEDENIEIPISELLYDDYGNPENELIRSMIIDEIQGALDEMPKEQSIVFDMNELQGIPFKDISELLNVPVNTLISRKRYAVQYLRERLVILFNEIYI